MKSKCNRGRMQAFLLTAALLYGGYSTATDCADTTPVTGYHLLKELKECFIDIIQLDAPDKMQILLERLSNKNLMIPSENWEITHHIVEADADGVLYDNTSGTLTEVLADHYERGLKLTDKSGGQFSIATTLVPSVSIKTHFSLRKAIVQISNSMR